MYAYHTVCGTSANTRSRECSCFTHLSKEISSGRAGTGVCRKDMALDYIERGYLYCSAIYSLEPRPPSTLQSSLVPRPHLREYETTPKRKGGLVNIVQHFCTCTEFQWHSPDWLIWQLSHLYWASLQQTI